MNSVELHGRKVNPFPKERPQLAIRIRILPPRNHPLGMREVSEGTTGLQTGSGCLCIRYIREEYGKRIPAKSDQLK